MKLYLVRHAEARSEAEDPERDLSPEGVRTVQKMAEFLRKNRLRVDVIRHSGKKRAEHTAEILAGSFLSKKGLEARSGLSPNDDVGNIADELEECVDDTVIVGHLPFLSRLASHLLTGRRDRETVDFACGCVLCLAREDNDWRVSWCLAPEIVT